MKLKKNSVVFFEPKWPDGKPRKDKGHPLKWGERVIYLGEIEKVYGHCICVKYNGEVVVMIHTDELRKAKESEL